MSTGKRLSGALRRFAPAAAPCLAALALAACGATTKTEKLMLEWGGILNVQVATGFGNSFPHTLDEIPPELRGDLGRTDGWGNQLVYQRLRDDRFRLVSGGADGTLGNADDVVMINNRFVDPVAEYASNPLKL